MPKVAEGEAVQALVEMRHMVKSSPPLKHSYQTSFQVGQIACLSVCHSCDIRQTTDLAKVMLTISAPDTKLELSSPLMANSFLKYKWKESLPWILLQLIPDMTLEPVVDDIGNPQKCPTMGVPDVHTFLRFLDTSGAIPIASNPHSIFVFSSLQNFAAGVYDTINANLVLHGHLAVSHLLLRLCAAC